MGADLIERDSARKLALEADVDQRPARFRASRSSRRSTWISSKLSRVRVRGGGDLGDAVRCRGRRVAGVVEQHAVAGLHLAHEVARLVVAHAGPRFGADTLQVVDREIVGLGLHQPIAFASAHAGAAAVRKVSFSVQTASSATSHGSGDSASTCCVAKPAPTSQGGAARALRNAKLRSYQPAPMPRRWPARVERDQRHDHQVHHVGGKQRILRDIRFRNSVAVGDQRCAGPPRREAQALVFVQDGQAVDDGGRQAQLPGVQGDLAVHRPVAGDMAAPAGEGQRAQAIGQAIRQRRCAPRRAACAGAGAVRGAARRGRRSWLHARARHARILRARRRV